MSSEELISTTQRLIKNSGLVILHHFLCRYFTRIDLLDGNKFKNQQKQREAIYHLQFLASEKIETQARGFELNNILCGLDIDQSIDGQFELSAQDKEIAESLLHAAIDIWPALGNCSLSAFRENWLLRDGWLSETEQSWQLTIERRAYDVLLDKVPFSYQRVMLPWMIKPLHIHWFI